VPQSIFDSRPTWLGGHDGVPPTHLHKEEVYAVLMWAGRTAGFTVPVEVAAPTGGRVDCVWMWRRRPVVVFEIDGRDVANYKGHLDGNAAKFNGFMAPLKVQLLYSVKNSLQPKPPLVWDEARAALPPDVRLITDEQLLVPGRLARLVAEARAAADALPREQTVEELVAELGIE
jgi:hypothetical protein